MSLSDIGDPRLQELFGAEAAAAAGVKPVVRLRRSGPPNWAIGVFALLAAVLLFWVLESRREAQPEPEVRLRGNSATFSSEPPPLYIPPVPQPQAETPAVQVPAITSVPISAPQPRAIAAPPPQIIYQQAPAQAMPVMLPAPRTSPGEALVIDTSASAAPTTKNPTSTPLGTPEWSGRARASTLANRTDTVAQGALIPAVLETAFDSTSPGLARAIVSRDVRGFDGKKVLIPRGSRLIGQYQAEVTAGQKRAQITWTRLIRPDAVTIDLDSPATDTLGRGGVRASVNTHFWERLGNALLSTTLGLGSSLATRATTGSVFVALPNSGQTSTPSLAMGEFVPTLRIKAGTSISVFVSRDLEFPDAGTSE